MIHSPILITGCARSGTSMTGGIVSMSGAFGGTMSGPNGYNQKGMFENAEIKKQQIKPYLRKLKCDPLGQYPLPDLKDIEIVDLMEKDGQTWFRNEIVRIMRIQGYEDNKLWFYKGAKMCLMYPLWHSAFPDAKWIIVRRETEDIVNSCMKTSFMRSYKSTRGWELWVKEHLEKFQMMRDECVDIIGEVWPQKMINGDFSEVKGIIEKLGLEWKDDQAKTFITPELWKGGRNGKSV